MRVPTPLLSASEPGTARSVCRAALSAGCSQLTAEIWGKVLRGRVAGRVVLIENSKVGGAAQYGLSVGEFQGETNRGKR